MTPEELVLKWLAEVGRIRALEPERQTETDEWLLSLTREYARVLPLWQRGADPSVHGRMHWLHDNISTYFTAGPQKALEVFWARVAETGVKDDSFVKEQHE
jgi:hypothetical protein